MAEALAVDDALAASARPGYAHDGVKAHGGCTSAAFVPDGFPLQMVWSRLGAGASLRSSPGAIRDVAPRPLRPSSRTPRGCSDR